MKQINPNTRLVLLQVKFTKLATNLYKIQVRLCIKYGVALMRQIISCQPQLQRTRILDPSRNKEGFGPLPNKSPGLLPPKTYTAQGRHVAEKEGRRGQRRNREGFRPPSQTTSQTCSLPKPSQDAAATQGRHVVERERKKRTRTTL